MEKPTPHELMHDMVSLPNPYKNIVLKMWEAYGEDFKELPASNKYHSNFPGGLLEHTVWTIRCAKTIFKKFRAMQNLAGKRLDFTIEEAIFVLILHDFGKIRSMKVKPYRDHVYTVFDMLKEVGVELEPKYVHAIFFHHGGYGPKTKKQEMLTIFVHTCDMWSSYFVEVVE